MTHTERRKLIEQPFDCQVIPGKTHAGTIISNKTPTDGRSMSGLMGWLTREDEEWFAKLGEDFEEEEP